MSDEKIFQATGQGSSPQPTAALQDEFTLLMSLRLDNLLDETELAQFDTYVQSYPLFARQWRDWQRLHQQFEAAPHVAPPRDLVNRVEVGLVQQARRRRLWQGLALGATIMLLWGGLLATVAGLGTMLLFNEGGWLNDLIHQLAFISVTTGRWVATGRATINTLVASPQAAVLGLCYVTLAVVLLSLWVRFLRRTTSAETVSVVL
jgi:hypothetical protein